MGLARHSHFLAHSSTVNALQFGRKSGQVAATGGDDNVVSLWRLREKETKNIMNFSGSQSPIESIIFDPNERKVVAGSKAGSIKVYDLESAKLSRSLKGHMSSCQTLDYHGYGDYIASGALDTIVKVWDLRTKNCMQAFKGHQSEIKNVCFTPDGRWLTSGDRNGCIKIWDLSAGKLLHDLSGHNSGITSLQFNPEEFILVSASSDKTIRFWDVQDFELLGITPTDNGVTTAMCHTSEEPYAGKYLFCCSQEAIRVWSYEQTIECHDSVSCQRPAESPSLNETHMDAMILENLNVMLGSVQDAFVSIYVLDARALHPFRQDTKIKTSQAIANHQNIQEPASTSSQNTQKSPPSDAISSRQSTPSAANSRNGEHMQNMQQDQINIRPITPSLPVTSSSVDIRPTSVGTVRPQTPLVANIFPIQAATTPSVPTSQLNYPNTYNNQVNPISTPITSLENTNYQKLQPNQLLEQPIEQPPFHTTDYIMELRCGMETCVKTFKARQKCVQEVLRHWEKGNLHSGLRYLSQLPTLKRDGIIVDVLRTSNFKKMGLDMEACCLLLPMVSGLLLSKFETYLSIGVSTGSELLEVFGPIVNDSKIPISTIGHAVDLAAEQRLERCNICDRYFKEINEHLKAIDVVDSPNSILATQIRDFRSRLEAFIQ